MEAEKSLEPGAKLRWMLFLVLLLSSVSHLRTPPYHFLAVSFSADLTCPDPRRLIFRLQALLACWQLLVGDPHIRATRLRFTWHQPASSQHLPQGVKELGNVNFMGKQEVHSLYCFKPFTDCCPKKARERKLSWQALGIITQPVGYLPFAF